MPPLEYPGQFNVEIELALAQGVRPTGFDRLNTLWWTLPLVRLSTGAMLRIRKQPEANDGDIVLARIGQEVMLKRYRRVDKTRIGTYCVTKRTYCG